MDAPVINNEVKAEIIFIELLISMNYKLSCTFLSMLYALDH